MGYKSLDTTSQNFKMLNSRFKSITVWIRVCAKIRLRVKQASTGSTTGFPGNFWAIRWNSKILKYKLEINEDTSRYFRGYFGHTMKLFWGYFDGTLRIFHSLEINFCLFEANFTLSIFTCQIWIVYKNYFLCRLGLSWTILGHYFKWSP